LVSRLQSKIKENRHAFSSEGPPDGAAIAKVQDAMATAVMTAQQTRSVVPPFEEFGTAQRVIFEDCVINDVGGNQFEYTGKGYERYLVTKSYY
jgi:hypothetical protein